MTEKSEKTGVDRSSVQSETNEFLDRMVKMFPEFEIDGAVRRLGGNLSTYMKVIEKFAEVVPEQQALLSNAIAANNVDTVISLAHLLKGMGSSIGAVGLYRIASTVENALKNREAGFDFNRETAALCRELAQAVHTAEQMKRSD